MDGGKGGMGREGEEGVEGVEGNDGVERRKMGGTTWILHQLTFILSGNKKVGRKDPVLGRGVSSSTNISVP